MNSSNRKIAYNNILNRTIETIHDRSTERDSYYSQHICIYSRCYMCIDVYISSAMGRDNLAGA